MHFRRSQEAGVDDRAIVRAVCPHQVCVSLRSLSAANQQQLPILKPRRPECSDEIELSLFSLRRREEDFLVEPSYLGVIETVSPVREKAAKKLLEKLFEQNFQTLIVIGKRNIGHRMMASLQLDLVQLNTQPKPAKLE